MGPGTDRRVLVVEDDEDVAVYLSTWFSDQGFAVELAGNGAEALEKLRAGRPDLITLDIIMPEKTGVKFYREVKGDQQTADIPVIIITGLQPEFKNFISRRRTAPAPEGYLSKPFGEEDLRAEVEKVLRKRPNRAAG